MQELIKRRVVFTDSQNTMRNALKIMREVNISSIFVSSHSKVVGLFSERDVVQKFTLLDHEDKLNAKVEAFMTRPVLFARLQYLEEDVRRLFFQHHIRHFPITIAGNEVEDIIGIITVTDISHAYLRGTRSEVPAGDNRPIVIIAGTEKIKTEYEAIFQALKFDIIRRNNDIELLAEAAQYHYPILLDIDHTPIEIAKKQLGLLKKHPGIFIVLSSEEKLVNPLAKMLSNYNHFIALKPLDISHILRLLQTIDQSKTKL